MAEVAGEGRSPSAGRRRPPRGRHIGPLAPTAVPCSALGIKEIHAARTMGPPSGAELVSPSKWLAAHEKEPRLPQPAKPASPKERRKAPCPARDDAPLLGLSSGKDWVAVNVAEAAAAAPKYQEAEEVRYVFNPYFGELPPYLRQRKAELATSKAAAERAAQPREEEEGVQVISGEALADLIRHLKLKWQDINQAYVRLPCVLDTPSKKRRKEELEQQLAEIERDVRMLSKATSVRVSTS